MPSEVSQTQKNCVFYGNIYMKYPESVNLWEKILVDTKLSAYIYYTVYYISLLSLNESKYNNRNVYIYMKRILHMAKILPTSHLTLL